MHVISEKKLREFWTIHPDAKTPLLAWLREAEHAEWRRFADVRQKYPHADQVEHLTVFNIGGNKYRLVAAIHFNRRRVYVRRVLTHADYDKDQWKSG